MAVLCVETNLLVAAATGRAPFATILLFSYPEVRLVVPAVCFLEAMAWLEGEAGRRKRFGRELEEQATQLRRDVSGATRAIVLHLGEARSQNDALLKFIGDRLFEAMERLSRRAEILTVTPENLAASYRESLITEPTDNLILHIILEHARSSQEVQKAFLTENHRDFDSPDVRKAIKGAGLAYFRDDQGLEQWIDARRNAPDG